MNKDALKGKWSEIARLRDEGWTYRQIAETYGVNHTAILRGLQKWTSVSSKSAHQIFKEKKKGTPPPDHATVGQVADNLGTDGTITMLTEDEPANPDEMCKFVDRTRWVQQYYRRKDYQGFYTYGTGDGRKHRKVQLYGNTIAFKRVISEEFEDALLSFMKENVRPLSKPKISRRRVAENAQCVSMGIWDAHLGMYAWREEVGGDYDLDIAMNRVCNSIDDLVAEVRMYPIEKIWLPVGNDFLHFDGVRQTTAFGDHLLDTDTRFGRVLRCGFQCLCYQVERATELCDDVEVLYIPGNHDTTVSMSLVFALRQRYLNDPRVSVDVRAMPIKWRMYGGSFVGFHHGHKIKPQQYPILFATEAKAVWSQTTYREVQIGHKHQHWEKEYEGVIPTNGMKIRMNPALCNVDAWHFGQGMLGEPVKSVEAWRYDKVAFRGSHVAWARDEQHATVREIQV